ncbi:MAG: ornithine cyclodeaminase [Planctomycetaceae bacterium]|nr:ornithine cyclodeaminase [Planctomycetaceae bacterium]
MAIPVLTDEHVGQLDYRAAVAWMQTALQSHSEGTLDAPARVNSKLTKGEFAFTIGAHNSANPYMGFRVYDLAHLHSPTRSEVTAVFNGRDGSLTGIVTGKLLGAIRTGAIGGVAISCLSNPNANILALLGTGLQARTQLRAACAVRHFHEIRVYSRDAANRNAFREEMSEHVPVDLTLTNEPEQAVRDADVVICATTSTQPIIKTEWLKQGVHLNNVGPKFKTGHELPRDTYEQSPRLVTDSLEQVSAFGDAFVLFGTPHYDRIGALSAMLDENATDSSISHDSSLFISVGLAGTEVVLAQRMFENHME